MTLDKLKETLKDNKASYSSIETKDLYNIFGFVTVNLQMDNKTLDYYYEINVNELLDSDMPDEELETMRKQGWAFSDNEKYLVLYLKN